MALFDVKVQYPLEEVISNHRIVASGSVASINSGEPTKQGTSGAVVPMANGDGTTSQLFTGIAKTVSTDTVAANGEVYVWLPLPGIVYRCKAKVAANANTQALIDALQGKRVVWSLASSTYTVDTAAGDASTNGLVITGGDYRTSEVFFIVSTNTTIFGE